MELLRNSCWLCSCPGRSLCAAHEKLYVLEMENGWVRKRKRLQKGVRRLENAKRYHNTETKLLEILKVIFGRNNVIASVHPLWALSLKNVLLEYDIGVTNRKLLVEYNGQQHYQRSDFFHKTKQDFYDQVSRDRLKEKLSKENGWKLIIIKYTEDVTYGSVIKKLQQEGVSTCQKIEY